MSVEKNEDATTLKEIQTQVKKLISNNKTHQAIKLLKSYGSSSAENLLVNVTSRFNKLQEQEMLGVIDENAARIELNKIHMSIIGISENADLALDDSKPGNRGKLAKRLIFLIPLLLIAAAITFKFIVPSTSEVLSPAILDGQHYEITLKGTVHDLWFKAGHWNSESNGPQTEYNAVYYEEAPGYGNNNLFRFEKQKNDSWIIIAEDQILNNAKENILYTSKNDNQVLITPYTSDLQLNDVHKFQLIMGVDSFYKIKSVARKEFFHVDRSKKLLYTAGKDITEDLEFKIEAPYRGG